MDLNEAINAFNATEANLGKLERLWSEMDKMLPSIGVVAGVADEAGFKEKARQFRHVLGSMPRIDGLAIPDTLPDADRLLVTMLDIRELDEPSASISFDQELRSQGEALAEYRFRLDAARRRLTRQAILRLLCDVDECLGVLAPLVQDEEARGPVPEDALRLLGESVHAIDTLLGSSVSRPKRWSDLSRHLHFGVLHDLRDIIRVDWPMVRSGLERSVYGRDDPLPVGVEDLGALASDAPTGKVVSSLKWDGIDAETFERLIFNLLDGAAGYENPQWLTHTNAPDRGRDVSVDLVHADALSGTTRRRVIVACKHYTTKSVGVREVTELQGQMKLWDSPRVDALVIATSGRFTTDAVDFIEKHNGEDHALRIMMWPGSHLELLLAARPALIAEFGLR